MKPTDEEVREVLVNIDSDCLGGLSTIWDNYIKSPYPYDETVIRALRLLAKTQTAFEAEREKNKEKDKTIEEFKKFTSVEFENGLEAYIDYRREKSKNYNIEQENESLKTLLRECQDRFNEIDSKTAGWSAREPKWWVNMMATERKITAALKPDHIPDAGKKVVE